MYVCKTENFHTNWHIHFKSSAINTFISLVRPPSVCLNTSEHNTQRCLCCRFSCFNWSVFCQGYSCGLQVHRWAQYALDACGHALAQRWVTSSDSLSIINNRSGYGQTQRVFSRLVLLRVNDRFHAFHAGVSLLRCRWADCHASFSLPWAQLHSEPQLIIVQ